MKTLTLALLSGLVRNGLAIPTEECPILGPVTTSGFDLSTFEAIKNATDGFPSIIESFFKNKILNETHTSFAINVFSTATNESLYSYYHAAEALNDTLSTGKLDDGTVFRTGSVSKLFTAYALLVKEGFDVLDKPVTEILPELAGNNRSEPVDRIIWEDVTVGALLTHQGGSGSVPLEVGNCPNDTTPGCGPDDFIVAMRERKRPVALPFNTPAYSDGGYAMLGMILQRLTGMPYNDVIQTVLAEPLGLNVSGSVEPTGDDRNVLAVPGNATVSSWGQDRQVLAATGGVYSNGADLRKFGLSILNSALLSPVQTRRWMKPAGNTASLTTSVGGPWEIQRLSLPLSPNSNRTRVSDLYTKLGGNAGYAAVIALSPDHGIGYTILTAGEAAVPARIPLRNAVGTAFVTAAEWAGWENAKSIYPGVYVDDKREGTNLTISVEEGRPGLGLDSFFINGTEWRSVLASPALGEIFGDDILVRLYPMGARSVEGSKQLISYRAIPQPRPLGPRSAVEGGEGLFDDACQAWESVGFWDESDDFTFEIEDGKVVSVTNRDLVDVLFQQPRSTFKHESQE
ncbi:hypothetical protein NW768_011199 [Fusarium equiseti]|uniref:Beta-lactamase-related domain-containing protein n=1 Tax=Fusarium equiseti TaxID=61235 RepID=A0ABQ8QXY4_FUSEQ|nr:hypothetical protein NW768_011199 [Fusarium equiseti]